jgi:UDP-N-acetylmuramyl pentapeptide phosphotransferase/UDP-N-acetylglucosamine-1-phosphate transferase
MNIPEPLLLPAAILLAATLSASIIYLIKPLLQRYALARPNARSSHRIPTPQGAGIAVIAATLLVAAVCAGFTHVALPILPVVATLFVAGVGLADDIRSIPVVIRLLLQAAAVGTITFSAPEQLRIVPICPLALERGLLLVAGIWFVNLVNFMDGLDLMTVVEIVPVTSALILLGWLGDFPLAATIIAAALCGSLLGFAPFNRPVAKVFLGDVGSLPVGLLLGWCLLQLAWHGHPIAACLLPLYYVADATITLVRRIARGEPFWTAHRSHFYQRAIDNGYSVQGVAREVFSLNVVLAALAIASVQLASPIAELIALLIGTVCVAIVLYRFSRRKI